MMGKEEFLRGMRKKVRRSANLMLVGSAFIFAMAVKTGIESYADREVFMFGISMLDSFLAVWILWNRQSALELLAKIDRDLENLGKS